MSVAEPLASKLLALGEMSQLTNIQTPKSKLFALFGSKLHTLFGASALAVWMYQPADRTLTLGYGHDLSEAVTGVCEKPVPVELFPETALAVEGGSIWTTEDISDSPLFDVPKTKELFGSMGARAVMVVPLRALTRVLGAVSFYYREPKDFTADEKAFALAFCNALALSLNNVEAYERLMASERIKSEVIDVVAHQFRTPIATLRGNIELLKDESVGGDPKMRAQIIEELGKVGSKLRKFVENFLNVKAIDEGRLEPHRENTNPDDLVASVVRDLEGYRTQHRVHVALQKLPGPVVINVDQQLVGEALTNVIGNAIKYAKQQVDVRLRIEGSDVVIAVQDDGVGIPDIEQPMIFQKLFRASNVIRHPEASSGLGLYIAKQYVERNGGRIWFTSEEGKGSTFFIAFALSTP